MRRFRHLLWLALICPPAATAADTGFSTDSSFAYLKVIAGDIGARPMGSPGERRAMEFAVREFQRFGCAESYIMPMTVAPGGINTNSGIAVGVLPGRTGRIIVIGGHIDSASPEIPGADDDGSGSACVLEVARVLAQKQHESTIIFCLWGGEEMGLKGSKYFAGTFERMDSVQLMLQVDMADGSSYVELFVDGTKGLSSPRWLAEAALDIFYNDLQYEGLRYSSHVGTLNNAGPGFAGSDHEPFLEAGIPAIDFTSDVAYPIHSAQDNLENFTPSGLKRTGDLVLKLVDRYDGGVPSRTVDKYYLLQFGSIPLFFSYPVLTVFVIFSLAVMVLALLLVRRRRAKTEGGVRVRWSGAKILLFLVVIQLFAWFSENLLELTTGQRFPWVNNYPLYAVLAVVAGLIGLWVTLLWATKLRISPDPFPLLLRAFIILSLGTIALMFVNVELAAYPAWAVFMISIAALVRIPALRMLFLIAAPYPIIRMVFGEWLGLIQRGLAQNPASSLVTSLMFAVVFTVIFLPFAYAVAGVYRDGTADLFWLKKFRGRRILGALLAVAVVMVIFLSFRSSYDDRWRREVRIEQSYTLGADTSVVAITSAENLTDLVVSCGGGDTVIGGRILRYVPSLCGNPAVDWLSIIPFGETVEPGDDDSTMLVSRTLELRSLLRPLSVEISYRSDSSFTLRSSYAQREQKTSGRTASIYWYSFPDSLLDVPVTLSMKPGQKVIESVTVIYDSVAVPIGVSGREMNVSQRLTVFSRDTVTSAAVDMMAKGDLR